MAASAARVALRRSIECSEYRATAYQRTAASLAELLRHQAGRGARRFRLRLLQELVAQRRRRANPRPCGVRFGRYFPRGLSVPIKAERSRIRDPGSHEQTLRAGPGRHPTRSHRRGRQLAVAGSNPGIASSSPRRVRFGLVRQHRRVWAVVAVVAFMGAGGAVYARTRPSPSPFVTTSVRYGTILDTVLVAGTLQPTQTWNLSFPAPGVVATVNVSPGQAVAAGQLLATLDPASLQAELTQAQANLTIAQAKLTLAETTSPPPPAAQITIDQADISIAQVAVTSAEDAVNSTRITAPAAGVVAEINISAGQADGASNARAVAASPDIVLESLSAFEVTASISDSQIAQVHVGQAALVVPAGQVKRLPGTVSEITPLASIVQGVAAFPVNISVTGDPPGLFAGAGAQVAIVVQRVSHVLTVPTSTVHGGGSSRPYVLVIRGGRSVEQAVTIGATDATLAQVSSGLTLGETVVLAQVDKPLPNGVTGLFGRKGGAGVGAKGRRGGKAGGGIP